MVARALGLLLVLCALTSCVTPATALVVRVDSDIADDRRVELTVAVTAEGRRFGTTSVLSRGVRDGESPLAFPSSFTVVPNRALPVESPLRVTLSVRVIARNQREADVRFTTERVLRFEPQRTQMIRVFLATRCALVRCGPGSTCDANGDCIAVDAPSEAWDRASEPDARGADIVAVCEPDCEGRACGDDGCGGSCGACPTLAGATVSCTERGRCEVACSDDFGDCDDDRSNGCETPLDTALNCGACANTCGAATPQCIERACASGCPDEQIRCGDECVSPLTNADHCGACGRACPAADNAAPACVAGQCTLVCAADYADCDRTASNGCEADLRADVAHCGACGNACSGATPVCDGAMRRCSSGCAATQTRCGATCADLTTSPSHCGRCGNACASGVHSTRVCAASSCSIRCEAGWDDCDGVAATGCEVSTVSNPLHCGGCGVRCTGTGVCQGGACVRATQVAVRTEGACALLSTGAVRCWGRNDLGQVGTGTAGANRNTPAAITGGRTFSAITARGSVTCGISGGSVYCWGDLSRGALGTSGAAPAASPTLVAGVSNVVEVKTSGATVCARNASGVVWCWGETALGQAGVYGPAGVESHIVAPRRVAVDAAAELAMGTSFACARTTNGAVYCWGSNELGALGSASAGASSATPLQVAGVSGALELAAGSVHACVRREDGSLRCWGSNRSGQLGVNMSFNSSPPISVALPGVSISRVWAGGARTCVAAGAPTFSVYCTGAGPLGAGVATPSRSFVLIPSLARARELSLATIACAVTAQEGVDCWGSNRRGGLGTGASEYTETPVNIPSFSAEQLETSNFLFVARTGRAAHCWGINADGECDPIESSAVGITSVPGVVELAATGTRSMFLQRAVDGPVSWQGQRTPTTSAGSEGTLEAPARVRAVSSRAHETCVIVGTGATAAVHCATGSLSATFSLVPNTTGASAIKVGSAGLRCALVGGEVRCWGTSASGAVFNRAGATTLSSAVRIGSITDARDFSVGADAVFIARATGIVSAIGDNTRGALGVGDIAPRPGVVAVRMPSAVSAVHDIESWSGRTCAAVTYGSPARTQLLCWGAAGGEFFLPGTSPFTTPVVVANSANADSVALNGFTVCFRRTNNQLACWGTNSLLGFGIDGYGYAFLPRAVQFVPPA